MADQGAITESTKIVLILFFVLLALIFLLLFLYKKLNREAQGEYTIRRIVYKEGGVRDRVRGAAVALGSRLGVQLWPGGAPDADGEEMREIRDVEGGGGGSFGSLAERNQEEEEEEEEEEEARESSDDTSRSLSSEEEEEEERDELMEPPKGEEKEAKEEEKQDVGGPEQVRAEGAGLLIDLKQFSGSAIWSEEGGCAEAHDDVTAL